MDIQLIGKTGTKRTEYFLKAAEELRVPVKFIDWDEVNGNDFSSSIVKLDPPSFQTSNLLDE